jgi:hypothetical protein
LCFIHDKKSPKGIRPSIVGPINDFITLPSVQIRVCS